MTAEEILKETKGDPRLANKLEQELYKSSLYLTCKYLLGYKDVNLRTHGRMIQVLESQSKRKLIVMPRGTFKSSIATIGFTIWSLIRNPDLRILIDSEIYSNSKNFLREIKLHLESEKITALFGQFRDDSCWNEGEIIIKQRKRLVKEASVTASGIGAQKTSYHADLILHDDLNSDKNSRTQEGLQKVIDHYKYNHAILEPEGTILVVGTRYSELDCVGFILKNEIVIPEEGEVAYE